VLTVPKGAMRESRPPSHHQMELLWRRVEKAKLQSRYQEIGEIARSARSIPMAASSLQIKQMTADRPEGHAFRPFVILLPSTLGDPRETL